MAGVALVALALAWSALVAGRTDTDASAFQGLVLLAALTFVVARLVGHRVPWLPPVVVALGVATTLVAQRFAVRNGPLGAPMGYGNANGAFYALGTLAAAIVAASRLPRAVRFLGAVLAAILLGVTAATGSRAALLLLVVSSGLALLLSAVERSRWMPAVAAAVVAAAVLGSVALGLARRAEVSSGSAAVPGGRRVQLWFEALELIPAEPVAGYGFGAFERHSPTAVADRDARWAHQEYLQLGVEAGLVGAGLLVLAVLWGFWAAYPAADVRAALAAAALACIAAHAALDYVLHFPWVVVLTAALAASSVPAPDQPARAPESPG